MMKLINRIFLLSAMAVVTVVGLSTTAEAQRRNDRDIRDAVRSLNSKLDDLETNLRYQMQSTSTPGGQVSSISIDVREMRDRIRDFQSQFDRRRENANDVNSIVDAAARINSFLTSNPQNRRVTDDWAAVKTQLDRLSANYGITTNWNSRGGTYQPNSGSTQTGTINVGLSGTYDLDTGRSENVDDVITDDDLTAEQRSDLVSKLTPPSQIAIDIRGQQVTLATSNASPVTISADSRENVETDAAGRSVRLKASIDGDTLTVSSLGGDTDYTIKFTSTSNGRSMTVSRRVTTDYLRQTVFAESTYNKTDSVARLGIPAGGGGFDPPGDYSDNDQSATVSNGSNSGSPVMTTTKPGNYTVPNGVTVSGILENEIDTKASQNNDRFRITVQSPNEFRGSVIEGYISGINRSGRVTGEPKITFNFEKIRLPNGQTYDFAGNLQEIKDTAGKTVKIDDEGTAKGDSQTKQTVKRGGIGAGIGAIIGAIAGGVKGAAIGAAIGGGAGAGSVIVQGKEDIRLTQGTTLTVISTSPMNAGPR